MATEKTENRFQALGRTKVINGSILAPENAGLRFVLSLNNMAGKADNVLFSLFDKKWKKIKEEAKGWYNTRTGTYKLGATNTTAVQSDTWAIHMLCQSDTQETDVTALEACLNKVCTLAKYEKATVHVSTLMSELVPEVNDLLKKCLVEKGVSVYFYQEPS